MSKIEFEFDVDDTPGFENIAGSLTDDEFMYWKI